MLAPAWLPVVPRRSGTVSPSSPVRQPIAVQIDRVSHRGEHAVAVMAPRSVPYLD